VACIKNGHLAEQAYYMAASGRPQLLCVVEGDVAAAVDEDEDLGERVSAYVSELNVTAGFTLRHTENVDVTEAYYGSVFKYRGMRLGTLEGLASWLAASRSTDAVTSMEGLSSAHIEDQRTAAVSEKRSGLTLQQLWTLHLHVLPGVGPARIDNILSAGIRVPAAFAAAYASVTSMSEIRALLDRLTPSPGQAPISKRLSV